MVEGAGQWQGKWIKKSNYFNLSIILKSSVMNFLTVMQWQGGAVARE